MLTLDATTASLEVVLAGAITTNQLPIVSSYVDKTTTTFTPGKTTTQTNSTSTVTIVAAPAASTQREVHSINVYNADTVAATITIRENDNGTLRILVKITLAVGDTLTFTHDRAWVVTDSSGNIKQSVSSSLTAMASQVFTSSGTFTTPAETRSTTQFKFTVIGAGGGGGGVAQSVSFSGAGGGGAGAAAIYYVTGLSPSTGYTVTVGAGGAGGAAGNNNGSNGGNSSIVIGATTVTAPGGSGGPGSAAGGAQGGAGGTVATNGTINVTGQDGGLAQTNGTNILWGGFGGNSILGGGAKATSNVAGVAAGGYGSGGSGASDANTANKAGGAGKDGIVIVEWVI